MKAKQISTNFNLNLKSSTPIQALEAKALKARAIAMAKNVEKANSKAKDKKKKPKSALSQLEINLRNLERAVQGWKLDGRTACFERGNGATGACATINIYGVYNEKKEEPEDKAEDKDKKKKAPKPEKSYVFYPDPLMQTRLGSVAIYGPGAKDTLESVLKAGHLFGNKISHASLEFGRYPFVDVKFSKF